MTQAYYVREPSEPLSWGQRDAQEQDVVRKVVFVSPKSPTMDGGYTVTSNLSAEFRRRGVVVEHISIYPGDSSGSFPTTTIFDNEALQRKPAIRTAGSKSPTTFASGVARLLRKRYSRYLSLRRFRRLLATYDEDTVVIFTHVTAKITLDEAKSQRRSHGPFFIGQHHSQFEYLDEEPQLFTQLPRHFADLEAFVALTNEDAGKFAKLVPVPCVGISNPGPPIQSASYARSHLAVTFARFAEERQLPLMVELFDRATSTPELAGWRLHIYGEGEEQDRIAATIRDLGLGERVVIKGRTSDVRGVCTTADLNMITCYSEGFGMTILEAGSVGVPTISFDCSPGVHGLIGDGAGFAVPDRDPDAYARILRACLRDDTERQAVGLAAQQRAAEYSAGSVVDEWEALFATIRRTRGELR